MPTKQDSDDTMQDEVDTGTDEQDAAAEGEEGAEAKVPLKLDVKIDKRGACQRHITVIIPREDIDRYFDKAFSEMMDKAQVPGFRPGRAPRKLIESHYRKSVSDQVKGSLVLDSMSQLTEEQNLAAISEPDIDPVAIEVPAEGPMTFEFDLEVRPEFDLPQWKGLKIERPVREVTSQDVDSRLKKILSSKGQLVPHDGPATLGDYISANLTFLNGETEVHAAQDVVIRIRPVLSFRDGKVQNFGKLMEGVKAGETREGKARLTDDAPKEELRGKEVTARFEVLEVKKLELPELTSGILDALGGFESEEELRAAVKGDLERQVEYRQQQQARQQVTAALTVAADWDLPPDLLRRQSIRELERAVLELRRSGFSDQEIRAHENELRQNNQVRTARALKEHFILERLAEEEKVEDTQEDYEAEIALIAQQSGESPRRVRASLEKRGLMDALRNQIIERKAIDLILSHATFTDAPFQFDADDPEAIDETAGGGESQAEIPDAKYAGDPAPTPGTKEKS